MRVAVVLSTYNGSAWLEPQLDSLLGQSHQDLRVVVRDDGSSDGTQALLAARAALDPRVTWTAGPNLGPAQSFLELLRGVGPDSDAVAFCDQDDVWEPDHLARALAALAVVPHARPAMWCSDLLVCDERLTPLRRHDVVRRGPSFANALVENVAPGCTVLLNRAAVDLLRRSWPRSPVMHDAWCYLVLSALGEVLYDPRPSVRYRLHGTNTMGLAPGRLAALAGRARRAWQGPHVGAWTRQARDLARLHGHELPAACRSELEAFLAPGAAARLRYAVRGRAHRQRTAGTVGVRVLHLLGRV